MTDRLRELGDRVSAYLVRLDLDPDRSPEGIFMLRYGSTVVMLSLFEDGDHTFVRMASTMLAGVETKLELISRILRLNTEVLFGAFLLFEDDTVSFTHTLLGDGLEFEAFKFALAYVARISDEHDEALQVLAGGERAEELLEADEPELG